MSCFILTVICYDLQEKRFHTFLRQKKQIADLMQEMDRSPETNFEKEVLCEEDTQFTLSADNMHSLDALVAEVNAYLIPGIYAQGYVVFRKYSYFNWYHS